MSCEARGIMRALAETLATADAHGFQEIRQALFLGEHDLTGQSQIDEPLISRLANYITYTIFSKQLRLTATQNLLVSQLMALGRRADNEIVTDPSQF